ncbi:SIMPL domain-containing protein [Halomonas sp. M4R1S46]|uniref:SIMPL domain-containing protein n=1 Tax=Halomonas sp. M4R1S46 TaxID=2982692 RepID=UPI0021E423FD|nr:SIMPL domain-containing protein [Halomonas sp. M4R1S46]UYG08623.1 SIMPL domain-containing protein [Halomonas sp. M4R1S46]
MPLSRLRTRLPGSLLAALLLTAPPMAAAADAPPPPRLDVQAQAELQVVPDQATLSARLWERTPSIAQRDDTRTDPEALTEARRRLEERAATLIRTLEAAGLEREAIQAGSLRVQPEVLHDRTGKEGEPTPLVRTRLERPFEVEVNDLERLPTILDALTEAGVNALDGVTYDLADREAATDEALTKALQRARHKAGLMAETLGVALGPVRTVSEQQAPVFQPRMMAMSADARESGGAAEYRPGTLTIDAAVNVSWEIEDEKSEE